MLRRSTLLVLAILCSPVLAQQRPLTLQRIFDPRTRENFSGVPQKDFVWIDDRSFLWPRTDAAGNVIEYRVVDAVRGTERLLVERRLLQQKILERSGMDEKQAERLSSRPSLELNRKRDAILLTINQDLYVYSLRDGTLSRLTSGKGLEEEPTFSPDGTMVAFVRDFDLWVVTLADAREQRLTVDGNPQLLNGKLDWVYQEEIYGRGKFRGYWWSPDSTRIAFLQLDEKPVPEFTLVDHIPYRQELEVTDYPKAGDPNPTVRLFTVRVPSAERRLVDPSKYAGADILIVDVSWTPDGRQLVYQVQDREQTWLDLNFAPMTTGAPRTLLRETTPAWVDVHGSPEFLADGSFLWFSERSGFKHLYHYRSEGTLIRQITSGDWEARVLHGVDEKNRWIYFSGTERSPLGSDVYRVRLDGSGLRRLSASAGTHSALFSPSFTYFLDTWSDISTPPQVHLHRSDGARVRTVDPNPVSRDYLFAIPEFLQVKTRDGFVMEAMMIRPPDFDPSREYPVYQHVYGGPHAQRVRNAWVEDRNMFHQLLATNGMVVWLCDNRTASGKGAISTWPVYKQFGETELRDIEDGVAWLKEQPWVDGSRILLEGWSYGGFLVSYALTHSKTFAAGIAGGSVTDWGDYDSIYTERYMLTPQRNPEGYRKSSPRHAAERLHGRLLLLHGTMDDNVHAQNTVQFAYALQQAGKPFEMMLYPRSRHHVNDPELVWHMRQLMFDFALRTLKR